MTRLEALLRAAETGSLRSDTTRDELAELVRLVREDRARTMRRLLLASAEWHSSADGDAFQEADTLSDIPFLKEMAARLWARSRRHDRARMRVRRILRGLPAFGGGE